MAQSIALDAATESQTSEDPAEILQDPLFNGKAGSNFTFLPNFLVRCFDGTKDDGLTRDLRGIALRTRTGLLEESTL